MLMYNCSLAFHINGSDDLTLSNIIGWTLLRPHLAKSLYTNIPHKEDLEALRITLDRENIPSAKANTIIEFSELVLTSNHFKFLGKKLLTDVRHSNGN